MIIDILNDEDLDAYFEIRTPIQVWSGGVMMTQPIDFQPGYMEFKDGRLVTTKRKLAEYKRRNLPRLCGETQPIGNDI